MTGVQTCALPICFPVTICPSVADHTHLYAFYGVKMKIVIGVDPDSDKHGVAVYADGNLCDLVSLSRVDLIKRAQLYRDKGFDVLFSIEDTSKNKGCGYQSVAMHNQMCVKRRKWLAMLACAHSQ